MTTTTLERDLVLDSLNDAGLDEDSLYESYSGRAMYGDTCFGIVGDPGDATRFLIFLAERIGAEDASDIARASRSDSMGLDTITYFPGRTVEED